MILDGLDGGGTEIYKEVGDLLRLWYPNKFLRTFEWCSGAGKIGYHLLETGITDSLCLADIHEPAVTAQIQYAENKNITHLVKSYVSDNLNNIPDDEKWDLVVANPPHFVTPIYAWPSLDTRFYVDQDWRLHRDFFANIKKFLLPGAKIFLWEACFGSSVETFRPWFSAAGLRYVNSGPAVTSDDPSYWYWLLLEN